MKVKTINSVITKKFNEWIATIEDEALRHLVEKNTICTGGCIASMLLREPVNDFDFYFRTKETAKAVANYYVENFKAYPPTTFTDKITKVEIYVNSDKEDRIEIVVKSAGIASERDANNYQYFESAPDLAGENFAETVMEVAKVDEEKPKYRPVFLSANAITLSDGIQLVMRFFGEPQAIHDNYDFTHCTQFWTSWENKVTVNAMAMESLLTKELRYVGSRYPLCSIIRCRKFIQRQWTISAGQLLKIMWQVNALDLENYEVLKEQLTGVDMAYFSDILARLREKGGEKIDGAYLMEIIDRLF